ncbi:uncharacterized protein BDV14DRAFT_195192 [Aspergillus stella-maris]|uniref:uncharacterized protein n=1 Tax=Aspergillus stella-maris TaxID=1810926 RepID=UPI003CCDB524
MKPGRKPKDKPGGEYPPFSPSAVTFEKTIYETERSAMFLITIKDHQNALKVHHGRSPNLPCESKDRNTNPHSCEATAYKRLQAHGLCSLGLVPKFHRSIEDLNPTHYTLHL